MITIISIGRKYSEVQPYDVHVSAMRWTSPPEELRKFDGRHPSVSAFVVASNPVVIDQLRLAGEYARTLARGQDQVHVVVECSEGIHRSVVGAEVLQSYLTELGEESTVFHRDLGRRAA